MVRTRSSPPDDPRNAAHAWARYRLILRWMALFTLVLITAVIGVLYLLGALVSISVALAAALGIGITVMLMAALMGLVFLSSGTGHDESIADPLNEEDEPTRWP
jgi:predicted anti-sigma-YlaC factor YlaD